jgi:chaperone required for assembly of F1-ATPase
MKRWAEVSGFCCGWSAPSGGSGRSASRAGRRWRRRSRRAGRRGRKRVTAMAAIMSLEGRLNALSLASTRVLDHSTRETGVDPSPDPKTPYEELRPCPTSPTCSTSRAASTRSPPRRVPSEKGGGFAVHLDGRTPKSPAKSPLVLPTLALAQLVAAEWDAQEEVIDSTAMPATRLAFTAIDRISETRAEVAKEVAAYAGSDLLCYRAEHPTPLVERQDRDWQPLLDWAKAGLWASPSGPWPESSTRRSRPRPWRRSRPWPCRWTTSPWPASPMAAGLLGSTVLALALRAGEIDGQQGAGPVAAGGDLPGARPGARMRKPGCGPSTCRSRPRRSSGGSPLCAHEEPADLRPGGHRRDRRLLRLLGLAEAGKVTAVGAAGRGQPGDLRRAADPHRQRRRRTGLRGLWRRLHPGLDGLDADGRGRQARPLGPRRPVPVPGGSAIILWAPRSA